MSLRPCWGAGREGLAVTVGEVEEGPLGLVGGGTRRDFNAGGGWELGQGRLGCGMGIGDGVVWARKELAQMTG